ARSSRVSRVSVRPARRAPRPESKPRRRVDWKPLTADSEVGGRSHRGVEGGTDAELLLDLLRALVGEVGVVLQEVAGVLLALAQLIAVVRVPGAGLLDEALLD